MNKNIKMERVLLLIRGCSGSGKSTFADYLARSPLAPVYSTDMFFMKDGKYEFDVSKLQWAHSQCREAVEQSMSDYEPRIFVANTFTTEWEMAPYFELAKKYDYIVFSVIVENRHNGTNVHNVPEETLSKQKARFDIKL